MNTLPFPKYIMIQTTSFCNALCEFCPYKEIKNNLPHGRMEFSLFQKIIDECTNYSHIERIMPYLMNDPLMDNDLESKINYIKTKNPNAWVHFLTNGNLLDVMRSDKILESKLDQICFSVYGVQKEAYEQTMHISFDQTIENICKFIQKAKKVKPEHYVMITFFKWHQLGESEKQDAINFWNSQGISQISVFDGPISRAGNTSAIKGPLKTKINGCNSIWTNEMIHILYNGDVTLCCMDWKREVVLGNIRDYSLYEIWHGAKYREVREKIAGKKETGIDFICKRCEASG